ncbi:hypothetical protein BCR37DRAFT_349550 [Protomyces lactucae-debilis]|uniref:non-specific serine/threonine protein kinase n=1 Tax=Protomyces lactucae-debilis TaxID=2754530 RepID=A0A1Y2F7K4_PROLT|nr:uncharacterized protein BCR37DRAFT_349550 [Protomyces lactucae-debilis]ORY79851.1 hypothetical protein BCR37DRAFT_349550 [Protomyces lactucae-debilis]
MLFQYSPRRAEESICSSNRAFVIQLLQRSTDTKITETTLFAWVEVAKGAAPSEMLVILTQLVEFLSHKNMLVRQSAVVGLKRLAAHAGCSLWALFSPYMRQISLQVCRKGQAQPQFISFFASLMGIHSTDFLVRNQQYLLPFLVIEGKVSLITEMAMATQQSVNNLIMNNAHFIFSSMLTSNLDKKQLMSFFSNIDSKFADVKLNDLICAVPIPLAVELLQLGGEPNIKPANIHAALTFVATVSTKPPASTRKTPMELAEELQRTFLTKHSLGIVGHLSEALNNAHGRKGLLEKVRIIRAFYDLVTLIEQASEAAVPQIVVCLQAAILMPDLRQSGLIAWHRLLEKSSHQVTTSLISHSMCLFLHIWDQATDIERGFMKQMFDLFIKDFSDHISQHIGQMPRITVAELRAVEEQLSLFRKPGVKPGDGLPPLEDLFDLLQSDNPIICERGLIELKEVITTRGPDIHTVLLKDRKDATVSETLRTLLDIVAKHQQHGGLTKLQLLASEILGMIGAVDPVRVDTAKDKSRAILLSSFMDEDAEETVGFVRIFLEDQLVEAFQSANNTKVQLSLAWAIQELLKFSGFDESLLSAAKQGFERDDDLDTRRRWRAISATSRTVFAPLLSSKWDRPSRPRPKPAQLPIIQHTKTYRQWLHVLVLHLLQLPLSENARKLFGVFSGILREEELEMANYLLPYLFLNGLFTKRYIPDAPGPEIMAEEVRLILETTSEEPAEAEKLRLATEAIFPVLDYLQHWRRSRHNNNTTQWAEKMKRQKLLPRPEDFVESDELTSFVDDFFMHLKPETLANGALRIGSYSRALYYWEQHIRNQKKTLSAASMQPLYATLQQLYINIDDPDGIEGVSVNLRELTIDQEILMHENAGRWTAAQSSYELALQRRSTEQKLQLGLLNCLRQTGHYDLLLEQAKSMMNTGSRSSALLDIAIESSWNLGAWADLQKLVQLVPVQEQTYDSLMGRFFGELKDNNEDRSQDLLSQLKVRAATELAASNTDSFQQCYEALAKLHIVHELDSQHNPTADPSKSRGLVGRDRFALVADSGRWKQHILSVRRVTLELKQQQQQSTARVVSHAWLESSKLARKTGQTQQAYKAILHALAIKGTPLAEIEHARWWWKGGHQLRAIQTLRKALASKVFDGYECNPDETYSKVYNLAKTLAKTPSEILTSKAQLLLTRWNDLAEHTNSAQQLKEYSQSARGAQLEKPHYFLGRYYMRLLEAEAKKPVEQQDDEYLKGEYHRHVVLSYGKAMHFGTKFIFQTLPSYLQLWLDFGDRVSQLSSRLSVQRRSELIEMRKAQLNHLNEKIKSFALRLPTYLYMLAFPQILSRLNHTDRGCFAILETILVKVLLDYPKQALWTFMAASKSRDSTRSQRGNTLIATLKREAKREKKDNVIRLVQEAQFVTDQLMNLCMTPVVKNRTSVSLTRDLHFDTACAPNLLVVPTQDNLTVILPSHNGMGSTKHHRAYEADVPTITAFSDEVDVMNSLQKPRKIVVRASDGILYPFLVKPNDDLRKDARLMDFNGVIQKFIRRDAEALKRTLRIRTYAVIALNEDHGLCEWVKNTRPLRDILIKTLKSRGVSMNYGEIKTRIETALGSSNPGHSFKLHVLDMYPPCFSEWFIEKFPDPSQWFTARLSYSRTLAVMSMVGFVLGLGDRHGENILFDETTGDAVHVDFNCLFEKGHTFEKPERVPFRLTHNLVDALGVTGVEGAFRKTCEITLRILRENQDAFNTVLESFLHDPVGEFLRKKKSTSGDVEKEEARKVLSVIASKLRGSAGAGIADKHVPLSIEGQADELIKQATDDQLLVRMYIGWTPWL